MFVGGTLLAGSPVEEIALRVLPDERGTPIEPYSPAEFESGCLSPTQTGEIVASRANIHLDGHGDHETKFRVGGEVWHRTGDYGYLDGRGRLWLMGRAAACGV